MSKLSEAKTYGGVGSILLLLAVVPSVGWLLAVAGAILVLVAIKRVSEAVADPAIFSNMLIAIVLALAGLVVGVVVIAATVLSAVGLGALSQSVPGSTFSNLPPGDLIRIVLGVIAGLAVVWILLLVSAIFVRKSYGSMATKLGVGMFRTSGLLYLIGAALAIVLVGFILIFVSLILNIIAFFSITEQPSMAPPMQPVPPAPAPSTV